MNMKKSNLWKCEDGMSALETAIILIAFVVVAAVFAFTILSAGTASTEQSKEAIYEGLEEVRSAMELRGAVVAMEDTTTSGQIGDVIFSLANAAGGEPIDLTAPPNNVVIVDYRDGTQRSANLSWSLSWVVQNDSDDLLEEGEVAELTVDLSGLTTPLQTNTEFAMEIKPPSGGIILMERTTPAFIDAVMDLR